MVVTAMIVAILVYHAAVWRTDVPEQQEDSNTNQLGRHHAISTKNADAKLGDGCYHVYLDVGSNVGVHARFLFEPEKYPNAKIAHHIFDAEFGSIRDNSDICVFAFEPNPVHKERHFQMQDAYTKLGWRYHPIIAGASDQDGNMTFYHQDHGNNNEWGFSTVTSGGRENDAVTVPAIRLSSWLKEHIIGRNIPEKAFLAGKNRISPAVVMKFDIEGSEYSLFPDLMFTGTLCSVVDYAFGEYHPWRVQQTLPDKETGRGGLNLSPGRKAKLYWENLMLAFSSLRNDDCKTKKIDHLDDESYHMDGVPLPEVK
jgi:hypothetical protein